MAATVAQVPATVGHAGASRNLDKAQVMNGVIAPGAPNDVSNTSRKLTLDDFARVRTLGTGRHTVLFHWSQTQPTYTTFSIKVPLLESAWSD